MKLVLILGGVAVLVYFILSARTDAGATPVVAPGDSKWRGNPPASPNLTVTQPGTDGSGQGPPRALYLAPVKSLRYYQ